MAYRVALPLARVVERGVATTLTCPVLDDDNAEQTPGAASTVQILIGSRELLPATTIDSAGPPATHTIAAALTADESLTGDWKEVWTLENLKTFTVRGYLVRNAYHSRLVDQQLQDVHRELYDLLPPGETTGKRFRRMASEMIQRMLLRKGRRPWLIFDPDQLVDAELYFALHYWANDASMRHRGNVDYASKAREYWQKAENFFDAATFDYDRTETGVVDNSDEKEGVSTPGYVATSGSPRRRRRWRGR